MQPFITMADQIQPFTFLSLVYSEAISCDYSAIFFLKMDDSANAEGYLHKRLSIHFEYRGDKETLGGVVTQIKKIDNFSRSYEMTLRPYFA